MNIEINNRVVQVEIKYRKRKTMALRIESSEKLSVVAPIGISEEIIRDSIEKKLPWIIRKMEDVKYRESHLVDHKFESGESFLFKGDKKLLKVIFTPNIKGAYVRCHDNILRVYTSQLEAGVVREALKKWYKKEALLQIEGRVEYFSVCFDVAPNKVKVKEQKSRWGSCSSKRDLYFNWKCIMAPEAIVDYLVVHEMCHMVHMNHSKTYWQLVGQIMPDYKIRRDWLKKYGFTLNL